MGQMGVDVLCRDWVREDAGREKEKGINNHLENTNMEMGERGRVQEGALDMLGISGSFHRMQMGGVR